ncbi:MAG TPA: helix-turn-helix transcriptional regulator [Gemmata sp.]
MKRSPFGEMLRRLRRDADLTLVDLAATLGVSVAYMSAIERGTRNPPSARDIQHLLVRLGCPERFTEMNRLAMAARRFIEIPLEGSGEDVADMLMALARRREEGTITPEEAKLILGILNKQQ